MRHLLVCLTACCVLVVAAPGARAQDKFKLFGGYSYLHFSTPVTTAVVCPTIDPGPPCGTTTANYGLNLNGWEISGTYKLIPWFGMTADFDGHYGTTFGAPAHVYTFLFGPEVSFPGRVSPFAHVLFGGAHGFIGNEGSAVSTSANAFATAVGGGIDIKVLPAISFRPIQMDYLVTRFNSGTQSSARFSAGIVVDF